MNLATVSVPMKIHMLRTLDTVATFYRVNFKVYHFFCKKPNVMQNLFRPKNLQ